MELQPDQIPESYKSVLEKFEYDPESAIESLQNRVKKRHAGAIGYFFLAWLYLKQDDIEMAIEAAWQARVRAPGSLFFGKLHYFIEHPHRFEAWQPMHQKAESRINEPPEVHTGHSLPISDLDSLIDKLSSAEPVRLKHAEPGRQGPDMSEESSDIDDIVTETLAVIHEKQGNYLAAINTYKKLISGHPDKEDYFIDHIKRLEKNRADAENGESNDIDSDIDIDTGAV